MGHTPTDEAATLSLPFRVYGLEGQAKTQDAAITQLRENQAATSAKVDEHGQQLARQDALLQGAARELTEVKTDVSALAVSVSQLAERIASVGNRVAWSLAGAAFTVAVSALGVILAS